MHAASQRDSRLCFAIGDSAFRGNDSRLRHFLDGCLRGIGDAGRDCRRRWFAAAARQRE